MPVIYRYIVAISIVLGALLGAYRFGVSVTTTKLERDALEARLSASEVAAKRVSDLADKLRIAEANLLAEQEREAVVREIETIKYRTIYRDKIIEVPSTIRCIDNSGLLDVINSTMPTVKIK